MSNWSQGSSGSARQPERSAAEATALEELTVAEEELRIQNETLLQMQATLEREHARYRELFRHAPVPYLVTDAFGTVREANGAAASLLQCPEDRLVGKPLVVFTHDTSRRRVRQVIGRLRGSDESLTVRLSIAARQKRLIRCEAMATAARDHVGRLTEIRWLLLDRTRERRVARARERETKKLNALVAERTAELERAQRLKDQLVASVSHELRTGLSAIGGYSELLEMGARGPLSEPQRADVGRIHRAYEHLARIVDDLLNYSRVVAGQIQLDLADMPLSHAVHGALELIAPYAGERGVTALVSDGGSPAIVLADVERVQQVLVNLLNNAIKFGGGRPVQVRCGDDGRFATVDVIDAGPGVPEGQRDAIFDPFVRLRTDRHIPGAGLGLAISRDLARAMGGDLLLLSTEHGSTFRLVLPLSSRIAESTETG